MSVQIPASPVGFSSVLAVSALAPSSAPQAATAPRLPTLPAASSIVDLSLQGLLASAASSFGNDLGSLLTGFAEATPATVVASAEGLADAFNQFQARLGDFLAPAASLPGIAFAADNANLGRLAAIGIELELAAGGAGAVVTANLNINPALLATAAATDTAGTQQALTLATQSLLEQVGGFESRTAAPTPAALPTFTAGGPQPATAAPIVPQTPATPPLAVAGPTAAAAATPAAPGPRAPINAADALAAEARTLAARLALQNQSDDPTVRATRLLTDPVYAAVIAASHQTDFIAPLAANDPNALARELPGAVLPTAPTPPINYAGENAGDTELYLARARAGT